MQCNNKNNWNVAGTDYLNMNIVLSFIWQFCKTYTGGFQLSANIFQLILSDLQILPTTEYLKYFHLQVFHLPLLKHILQKNVNYTLLDVLITRIIRKIQLYQFLHPMLTLNWIYLISTNLRNLTKLTKSNFTYKLTLYDKHL